MQRVWLQDLNTFDFGSLGMFDCIICSHVLEHLIRPGKVLEALRGHLDRDGVLLVALPNALELKTRMAFLLGRFRTKTGILDRTHYGSSTGRRRTNLCAMLDTRLMSGRQRDFSPSRASGV